MDTYFFNYMCLHEWVGLSKDAKKLIRKVFPLLESIDWDYVQENRLQFGVHTDNALPFQSKNCPYLIRYLNLMEKLKTNHTGYVTQKSLEFPNGLLDVQPKCPILYYKGKISLLNDGVKLAIVGSRKPTAYGRKVVQDLVRFLVPYGITIVSGMALGIDALAHSTALELNGHTVAVLASGIESPYPKTNENLYKKIIEKNGLVISERGNDEPPIHYHFPLRNRLISGISDAVVVIEAAEKSGTLITARHGLDQGKTIFALPGSIYSERSKGTNRLISEGAYPLINFEDLLLALGIDVQCKSIAIPPVFYELSVLSQKVYKLLLEVEFIEVETLSMRLKCENSEITAAISELVLEDLCAYKSLTEVQIR